MKKDIYNMVEEYDNYTGAGLIEWLKPALLENDDLQDAKEELKKRVEAALEVVSVLVDVYNFNAIEAAYSDEEVANFNRDFRSRGGLKEMDNKVNEAYCMLKNLQSLLKD